MTDLNLSAMTKKELLAMAGEYNVVGRHDMTKDQLIRAILDNAMVTVSEQIAAQQTADEVEEVEEVEEAAAPAEELNELPVRPAIVEEQPKPKTARVNKSGNIPYKQKPYFLDIEAYESDDEKFQVALAKAPNQVRLILKCMAEQNVVDHGSAMIGREIVDMAKNMGYLNTTIPSANLFAYYRRELEKFGVTYTG